MHATAEYIDGVSFQVTARGHAIVTDQPEGEAGLDRGMTPPELLLASVASCAAHYALAYLQARQLPTVGLRVQARAGKATGPARLTGFVVEVETGELPERHREGILKSVRACVIHNTLLNSPTVNVTVTSAQPTPA